VRGRARCTPTHWLTVPAIATRRVLDSATSNESLAPVSTTLGGGALPSASVPPEAAGVPHDHQVGIYVDAEHLVAGVVDLIAPGLLGDDSAVVVATELHRRAIVGELHQRGIDVPGEQARGRLFLIDAAELLRTFRSPEGPHPRRFREQVTEVVEQARAAGERVRIFGEMVTLLWDEGDIAGALALEDLWNELLAGVPATLLCGYPEDAFAHARSTDDFRAVCERHSEVITATALTVDDEASRSRTLAMLEHERVVDHNRRADLEAQRRALEDALERLRDATERRDDLLAVVVHDIRSPATTVTNALALLLDAGPELGWDDTRGLLQAAHEAGQRIVRLSQDILTSAELDAGSFTYDLRPVDLARIVGDAVHDVRTATGRTVEYHHELDLPRALADEVRQRQILGNILGNAVKFSADDTPIHVRVTRADDRLEVRIRDAGPGIPAADQARLFRPFTRLGAPREVEGHGLGLHSAKLLTEGQGGTLWVESEPGHGAVFAYTVLTVPERGATAG
jgi:signal transduction histidine kinase